MMVSELIGEWSLRVALVTCLFELGGSLYEYTVVDAAWPANLALIQPERGGLDRKRFWMPLHGVLTLALPLALWAYWSAPGVRAWLLAAAGLYVVLRGWTFAYFIPRVFQFERGTLTDPQKARSWVRWSVLRAPLLIALTLCLWRASEPFA